MKHFKKILFAVLVFTFMFAIFSARPAQVYAAKNTKLVLATGKSNGKTSIKLTWKKVSGTKRYVIKYAHCGSDNYTTIAKLKKSKRNFTVDSLNKGNCYKFIVYAQTKKDGVYKTIAKSLSIHVVTAGSPSLTNPDNVKTSNKLTLTAGKSKKLAVDIGKFERDKKLLDQGHAATIRYVSSNKKIATVSKKGKIKAIKAGKCTIYAIAANGCYDSCKLTVKAKKKDTPAPTVKEYTVTYKYTGDVPDDAPAVPKAATYKAGASVKKASVPTAPEGWEFNGWKGEVSTMPEKNVTVTGTWSRKKVEITYYFPKPFNEGQIEETEYNDSYSCLDDYVDGKVTLKELKNYSAIIISQIIADIPYYVKEIGDNTEAKEQIRNKLFELRRNLIESVYLSYTDTVEYGKSYTLLDPAAIKTFADAWDNEDFALKDLLAELNVNVKWINDINQFRSDDFGLFFTHEKNLFIPVDKIDSVTEEQKFYPAYYMEAYY